MRASRVRTVAPRSWAEATMIRSAGSRGKEGGRPADVGLPPASKSERAYPGGFSLELASLSVPKVGFQDRPDNIPVDCHRSEQGILRIAVFSGNGRDKLGDRLAAFQNRHDLSGLHDFIENRQTFRLELGCIDFLHKTRLCDWLQKSNSVEMLFGAASARTPPSAGPPTLPCPCRRWSRRRLRRR